MTNYIELMMRTAGLTGCSRDILFIGESPYPLFLGRQQLEIIKLICELPYSIDFKFEILKQDSDWIVVKDIPIKEESTNACYAYSGRNKNFAEALAELTCDLMNAGELDKSKVKEILEQ